VYGGPGNDTFFVDDAADLVYEAAGEGSDQVWSSVSYALLAGQEVEILSTETFGGTTAINLTGNEFNQIVYGNSAANILDGGAGDDIVYALDGNDTLYGSAGIDYLCGMNGTDTLYGGDGNDTLNGGAGADVMAGGLGNDGFFVDDANDQVHELAGEGTDQLWTTVSYVLAAGEAVEILSSETFGSITAIAITGNELDQTVYGNNGANTLDGGAGNDLIYGLNGNDTLIGGLGNDTLNGGAGADTMLGGAGNDGFYVDDAADQVIEAAGEGTDQVWASVSFALAAGQAVEILSSDSFGGTAAINLTGNELGQTVYGNSGANTLDGGGGNDVLYGLAGDDTLLGGAGNDTLRGMTGADLLTGGSGNDTFAWGGLGDAGDTLTDFTTTVDKLDLTGLFDALGHGADSYGTLISTGILQIVTGNYLTTASNDGAILDTRILIDADGSAGAGAAITLATLEDTLTTAGDFLV
jgi:Ca2+-binding RTX toxin-like protein